VPDEEKLAPIIIIKKKAGHAASHGGAWKVAYADFVTAMMALFIVLWLMSSDEKVKKAVGGYFTDPSGAGKMMGTSMAGVGETLALAKDDMSQLKEKLEQAMKTLPTFSEMKDQVRITITDEGLRVELLETAKGMFFESGSAHPSANGRELLISLATEMGKLPNNIVIEGHTDSKPFSVAKSYTNWELSTDRANSARHIMADNGLRVDQVKQLRGFADQQLRKVEDPTNASNRRISVIVQYLKGAAKGEQKEVVEGDEKPAAVEHDAPKH
jgi:chemotaxis protein MotB